MLRTAGCMAGRLSRIGRTNFAKRQRRMSENSAEKLEAVPAGTGDDYWLTARRPLNCLLFLVPLLAAYEAGVLGFGSGGDEIRNGADYWMRAGLRLVGLECGWALPAIVVGLLVVWQIGGRHRWRISAAAQMGMLAESLLFGVCLIVLGQLQELAFRHHLPSALPLAIAGPNAPLSQAVSYLGAGIYEEVLFRLCLVPLTYGLLRALLMPRAAACLLTLVASSLLFATAHYVGPAAEPWSLYGFTFRSLAGGYFAMLFVTRGFGITVGAHAAYDLLVGILLPWSASLQHV